MANINLQLKTCQESYTDKTTGKVSFYDVFYVDFPQMPGLKLKLKPSDRTARDILCSLLGVNLAKVE